MGIEYLVLKRMTHEPHIEFKKRIPLALVYCQLCSKR
jgi:hypothetical protein